MADWLLTGGSGFLGSRILQALGRDIAIAAPGHDALDVTSRESCLKALERERPKVVVHASAISVIGDCEKAPALSRQVNLHGAENMALACAAIGAKLLFCSTDQVYTGCGGTAPLRESAALAPQNVYAVDKLVAEQAVLTVCPDAACLRLSWMFDLPVSGLKTNPNLIMNLLRALITGAPLMLPDNDHRAMTYAREVAENLPVIAAAPGGVYNFGAENLLSTYQTAYEAAKLLRAEERFLQVITAYHGADGRNLLMDGGKARQAGAAFSDTVEGIARMLRDYRLMPHD